MIPSTLARWPGVARFLRNLFLFKSVPPTFWDRLGEPGFRGDLWSVPEGTPVFPGEPVLRLTGRLADVQLLLTPLASQLTYQSAVATAAARLVAVAGSRPVVAAVGGSAPGPPMISTGSHSASNTWMRLLPNSHTYWKPFASTAMS